MPFRRFPISRQTVWFCLLLLLVLGAVGLWQWRASKSEALPEMVAVGRGDIETVIKAIGSIHPRREVEVGTLANGQLRSVKVKLGEQVRKGQLLAEIDPHIPENEVRTRRAIRDEALARQRAALTMLTYWERKRVRAQRMHQQDAGSLADAEHAQAEWRRHQAAVQEHRAALIRVQSELDTAEKRLSDTRIVAPINGQVLSFKILEGQTVVAAQTAQVIMVLADMNRITVYAQVSEADVSRVRSGQLAYFSTLAEPSRRIDSAIRDVEPNATLRANDASRAIYYNALLDVDNQDARLRPHMTADITIVESGVKDALRVPLSAILHVPEHPSAKREGPARDYVFLMDDKRVVARLVTLGLRDATHVAVVSGVREAEQVVQDVKVLGFHNHDPALQALIRDADADANANANANATKTGSLKATGKNHPVHAAGEKGDAAYGTRPASATDPDTR